MPFAAHSYDGGFVCIAGRSVPWCTPLQLTMYISSHEVFICFETQ